MNYIHQLNGALGAITADGRLNPTHVSLYLALFHFSNRAGFKEQFYISREEVMQVCKIGSANTYTRCIKDLDQWGYIQYYPSFNPHKGSQVSLCSFDTGNERVGTRTLTSFDKGTDPLPVHHPYQKCKRSDEASERAVRPFIKVIRSDPKEENFQTKEKDHEPGKNFTKANGLVGEGEVIQEEVESLEKEPVANSMAKNKKERRANQPAQPETRFVDSAFFDREVFRSAFECTEYQTVNLDYYHAALCNWRDKHTGHPPLRRDWLATARTFMLNDFKEGKLVTVKSHTHGKHSINPAKDYAQLGSDVDQYFAAKYGL